MQRMSLRRAPLLTLLLALGAGTADARVRLGDALPVHPWASASGTPEVVVIYSHDCGDLGALWGAVLDSGLKVRAVNAEEVAAEAPRGVSVWRGPDATAFARKLRVAAYPTVLLVGEGRILNAWEGTFTGNLGLE